MEPIFQRLYSFIFDMEPGYPANEMDRPVPVAIFVVNFDKVKGLASNPDPCPLNFIDCFLFFVL